MALKRVQGKNEWVNAEKGKGGSVRYAKDKNQWELVDKMVEKYQRRYFAYGELEEANRSARRLNESVREHGERFGSLSDAEQQAVMAYCAFTREKVQEGIAVSNMAEFMAAALQTARESRGNSSFAEASRLYLAHFEKQGHSVRHMDGVPECALAWLSAARASGVDMDSNGFILAGDSEEQREGTFRRELKRCRKRTGVLMPQNAFRHSAASYLCAKYEDYSRVSAWMGHSESVLMQNYRNLKRREEGEAFFNIFPE